MMIARIMRRNLLFSAAAVSLSMIASFIARPLSMRKDMRENPLVSQGTPSEKFTALNTSTYQKIVIRIGI
jgi:hypothetical protein